MKFFVCHEVVATNPRTIAWPHGPRASKSRTLDDWLGGDNLVSTKLGLRMTGFPGFRPFLSATVIEFADPEKLLAKSSKLRINQVTHIVHPWGVDVLMLVGEFDGDVGKDDFWIQRPGVAQTRNLLSKLGLDPSSDSIVYSTCVAIQEPRNKSAQGQKPANGLLVVPSNERSDFLNMSTYKLVCLLVAIERQLIGAGSRFLMTTRVSLLGVLRMRDLLIRWPSLPAIDSTVLAENYLSLRESLKLDLRKKEVLDALTLRSKRVETILAVSGLFVAFVTLGVSLWIR